MGDRPGHVDAIRQFNRFYTQKIGVLQEGLLDSQFSLAEVRVLYELAQRDRPVATELARDLGLDPGYLSRLVRRFEQRRYLARQSAGGDARRQALVLTAAGRRAFAALDTRARHDVAAMTAALTGAQRDTLVSAMHAIRATLEPKSPAQGPTTLVLRSHRPGDIGWVVQRHGELYAREYGWDERFEALVARIAADFIDRLDPQRERCWIAERDGRNVGCVFVCRKNRSVGKLRLLLVEPEARGTGLGRRLVEECIRFARGAGYRKLALWTQRNLVAARAIYKACGFRRVDARAHHSFGHALVAETWELDLR